MRNVELLNAERCKSVYVDILYISSRIFKRVRVFTFNNWRRYSRERASRSLPTITQPLEKQLEKHRKEEHRFQWLQWLLVEDIAQE